MHMYVLSSGQTKSAQKVPSSIRIKLLGIILTCYKDQHYFQFRVNECYLSRASVFLARRSSDDTGGDCDCGIVMNIASPVLDIYIKVY